MSTREEIAASIEAKGEEIRLLKAAKPPSLKTDLEPLVAQLLALKLSYKEVAGEEYGPPAKAKADKPAAEAPKAEREGPSKSELNKLKRKEAAAAAKAEARAEREVTNPTSSATPATQTAGTATEDDSAAYAHLFGDYKIIQSTEMTEKVYREVSELTDAHIGQNIWLRGRLANSRAVGKGIFLVLRQHLSTAQAVMFQG
jgi:hypothetical protein